jgi:hypothetical protein
MTEWGVTPEYINRWWTEELLTLMFIKRTKRIKRMNSATVVKEDFNGNQYKKVTDTELFQAVGFQPEVVRYASPAR